MKVIIDIKNKIQKLYVNKLYNLLITESTHKNKNKKDCDGLIGKSELLSRKNKQIFPISNIL